MPVNVMRILKVKSAPGGSSTAHLRPQWRGNSASGKKIRA
jgi:hypothetical protein